MYGYNFTHTYGVYIYIRSSIIKIERRIQEKVSTTNFALKVIYHISCTHLHFLCVLFCAFHLYLSFSSRHLFLIAKEISFFFFIINTCCCWIWSNQNVENVFKMSNEECLGSCVCPLLLLEKEDDISLRKCKEMRMMYISIFEIKYWKIKHINTWEQKANM